MNERGAYMSEITEKDIAHTAYLARLELSAEEMKALFHHFQTILDYVASLEQVPGLSLLTEPRAERATLREDKVGECLSAEEALANGPQVSDGRFVVPPIIEEKR